MVRYWRTCAMVRAKLPEPHARRLDERQVRPALLLAHAAHERNREQQPPHRHGHERTRAPPRVASARPNIAGLLTMSTLTRNNTPPPR